MTPPRPDQVVTVFSPTSAPYLASIAREFEAAIATELDRVLPTAAAVEKFAAAVVDEAAASAAFQRFRKALRATIGEQS